MDVQDLQAMKIGSQHVYKIWRSLVEYRNCGVETPMSAAAAATADYVYAVVPACAGDAVVVPSTACRDAALFTSSGGPVDVRLGDDRPPGRPKFLLKDDHNYC